MLLRLRSRLLAHKRSLTQWISTTSVSDGSSEEVRADRVAKCQGRIYEDGQHPIEHTMIPNAGWSVIWRLKKHGHEAFFVGGTVRDLCASQKPRDIDIVTSAELHEVKSIFKRSVVVGKRFPICLVTMASDNIEVSSFSTTLDNCILPPDLDKSIHANKMAVRKMDGEENGKLPITWSMLRYLNAISRDFSVNALMYEPCTQLLFDYANGFQHLKERRLCCLKDPSESFQEDPARMLRAIRFASRLGFSIDQKTGDAIQEHAKLLVNLPQSRAQHELNTILTHGSTATAFKLMWKYGILDWILPATAQYLTAKKCPKDGDQSDFLFALLEKCDGLKSVHRVMDEATTIVMIAAPLLAYDIQRLRRRLRSGTSESEESQKELKMLRRQREEIVFTLLTKNLLNRLPQMRDGGGMIMTRNALHRALDILKSLKMKHIHESHQTKVPRPVKASEQMAFRILEQKELKWKERTNLGLTMVDPEEECLQRP